MKGLRVVFWGTYDTTKPRNRILLQGLRANGVELIECHTAIWSGVADKSQISGIVSKLGFLFRWMFSYPYLVYRYLNLPKHDIVIIGYLGQIDMLVLWPFAKMRGVPVVLDIFISLYDTVVNDRRLVGRKNPVAWFLYGIEWLVFRLADLNLIDTDAHCDYIAEEFNIRRDRVKRIFVGIEESAFYQMKSKAVKNRKMRILFYGQFIPLHGIEWIVKAAELAKEKNWQWTIIGKGQEETAVRRQITAAGLDNLEWIPWVKYEELVDAISQADICLGIFGKSGKAARVIPNKVFQILASGKPLITMDSPAIREIVNTKMKGIYLVPPGDPAAIVNALDSFAKEKKNMDVNNLHEKLRGRIVPAALGKELLAIINELAGLKKEKK